MVNSMNTGFRTEGATHSTSCTEYPGTSSPAPGPGSCPYSQDNLSWAEYQVTIPMPGEGDPGHASGVDVFTVIMKFDADTTIVSQLCLSTVYINCAVHSWGFNNIVEPFILEKKLFWILIFRGVVTVTVGPARPPALA